MVPRSALAGICFGLAACAGPNSPSVGTDSGADSAPLTSITILMVNASGGEVASLVTELPLGNVRSGYSSLEAGRNGYVGLVVDPVTVRSLTVTFYDAERQAIACPNYPLPRSLRANEIGFTVELARSGEALVCSIGRPPTPDDPRLQ